MESLIYNQDKIKQVEIYQAQDGSPSQIIKGESEIQDIFQQIADIQVNRLTKEEDIAFMQNGKRIQVEGLLRIDFVEENPPNGLASGQFLVWPDGTIYAVDMKTMAGVNRTVAYLSKSKYPNLYRLLNNNHPK